MRTFTSARRSVPAATTPPSAVAVRPGSVWGALAITRPIPGGPTRGARAGAAPLAITATPIRGATLPTFYAATAISRAATSRPPTLGWCGGRAGPLGGATTATATRGCAAIPDASATRSPTPAGPSTVITRATRRNWQFQCGVRSFWFCRRYHQSGGWTIRSHTALCSRSYASRSGGTSWRCPSLSWPTIPFTAAYCLHYYYPRTRF